MLKNIIIIKQGFQRNFSTFHYKIENTYSQTNKFRSMCYHKTIRQFSSDVQDLEKEVENLKQENQKLVKINDFLEEKIQSQYEENDKLAQIQKQEIEKLNFYAVQNLAKEIVEIVETLEKAQESVKVDNLVGGNTEMKENKSSNELKMEAQIAIDLWNGIDMINKQVHKTLMRHKVTNIGKIDDEYIEYLHDVININDNDVQNYIQNRDENTSTVLIVEKVLEPGLILGQYVIRKAKVQCKLTEREIKEQHTAHLSLFEKIQAKFKFYRNKFNFQNK